MNELALFAGAGGGILGGLLLNWRTVCAVESNDYARRILIARQDDGSLTPFPIWDDVRTFDGRPWRGVVDIVTGGFPCTDISPAGRGAGIDGEQSRLWREMARIIGEVRPRYVLVENSPVLTARGLGVVLGDLAALGFDARWGVLAAAHVGLPILRERLWIVAQSNEFLVTPRTWTEFQPREFADGCRIHATNSRDNEGRWVEMARQFRRMDDGLANYVDRVAAIGNGQVPAVVALAWRVLGG